MPWVFAVVLVLVGPIVWAMTVGRRGRAPDTEDHEGGAGYGAVLNERNSGTPPR